MYLPYEVLREIIIRSDTQTIKSSFFVCKEFYKLSEDVIYWSERVDKESLCDVKIFKEFATYEQTTDLEKLTKQVVRSDNMELIHLFDDIRKRFSILNKEQVQKYVMLLTTSAASLYTFFYKLKYFKKKCSYQFRRGEKKGKFCERKTLSLCDFCAGCLLKRDMGVYDSLFMNFVPHEFIVMSGTLFEGRIIRDVATNFVFYNDYEACTLTGKISKGIISTVSEEDKSLARSIYESFAIKYIIL